MFGCLPLFCAERMEVGVQRRPAEELVAIGAENPKLDHLCQLNNSLDIPHEFLRSLRRRSDFQRARSDVQGIVRMSQCPGTDAHGNSEWCQSAISNLGKSC